MALKTQDIQRIAHLARIDINAQEADATLEKLSGNLLHQPQKTVCI